MSQHMMKEKQLKPSAKRGGDRYFQRGGGVRAKNENRAGASIRGANTRRKLYKDWNKQKGHENNGTRMRPAA